MATKVSLVSILALCCLLAGFSTAFQKSVRNSQELVQPEALPKRLASYVDALYLVETGVIFYGSFEELPSGKRHHFIRQSSYGSGFAIDSQGHVLTSRHVISPHDKIRQAFNMMRPQDGPSGPTGFRIHNIDGVRLIYRLSDNHDWYYTTTLEVTLEIEWELDESYQAVKNFTIVSMEPYGQQKSDSAVQLIALDEPGDLALFRIKTRTRVYIPVWQWRTIFPGEGVVAFSMHLNKNFAADGVYPRLEVVSGTVISMCTSDFMDGKEIKAAHLDLVTRRGYSGGPVVNSHDGTFIGVARGARYYSYEPSSLGSPTIIVPGGYVQAFFYNALNSSYPKPEVICVPCGDTDKKQSK